MRILHRLVRRWYEEQGITRDNCPYTGIKQYGSFTVGYSNEPVCNLALTLNKLDYINWYEDKNIL